MIVAYLYVAPLFFILVIVKRRPPHEEDTVMGRTALSCHSKPVLLKQSSRRGLVRTES